MTLLGTFIDSDSDYSLHKEEDDDAPEKKTFPLLRDVSFACQGDPMIVYLSGWPLGVLYLSG